MSDSGRVGATAALSQCQWHLAGPLLKQLWPCARAGQHLGVAWHFMADEIGVSPAAPTGSGWSTGTASVALAGPLSASYTGTGVHTRTRTHAHTHIGARALACS